MSRTFDETIELGPLRIAVAWLLLLTGIGGMTASFVLVDRYEIVELNFFILVLWNLVIGLEGWNALRSRPVFLGRGLSRFFIVAGFSTVLWFGWEFYNLYLGHWYFTGYPPVYFPFPPGPDWLKQLFSFTTGFGTVLPIYWESKVAIDEFLPQTLDRGAEWSPPGWFLVALAIYGVGGSLLPLAATEWTRGFRAVDSISGRRHLRCSKSSNTSPGTGPFYWTSKRASTDPPSRGCSRV